jgi:hypothetical protein
MVNTMRNDTERECAVNELLNIYEMSGEPRKTAIIKFQNEKCAKEAPLQYVTVSLLSKGYFEQDGSLRLPNVIDLRRMSCARIFHKKPVYDYFVSGKIELPNGQKQTVFIEQNDTGRYTIMIPEDR